MKRILFFITVFFLLASVNAQEQEVPDVPEVPAIYNDKENEKVIKVEIVNDSSLDAAFPKGKNCLLYTSPSPRDPKTSRMPSSA